MNSSILAGFVISLKAELSAIHFNLCRVATWVAEQLKNRNFQLNATEKGSKIQYCVLKIEITNCI